jgi:hypothetical protein
MKMTNILLSVICLLLAMAMGFVAGRGSDPRFMAVKVEGLGDRGVVLVINTRTGELAGRYDHHGEYTR